METGTLAILQDCYGTVMYNNWREYGHILDSDDESGKWHKESWQTLQCMSEQYC